jgi:D-alanyl-D-alanine carboxypeptidase/D-alanyl-D-alanine-endopeptidase (penicillin-binding protein 4)
MSDQVRHCLIPMRRYLFVRFLPALVIGILLLALLVTAGCMSASRTTPAPSSFESEFSSITGASRYAHASWGMIIVDPVTNATLYERNADQMYVPGSTTKLFSSAAALEALGPDYRFSTPVYAMGFIDGSGKLDGNLVLVASGDPDMGGRTLSDGMIAYTNIDHGDANALGGAILTPTDPIAGLDNLASQVKASGITAASDVVIDDRLFEVTDLGKEHVLSPIIVNDNLVDVTITPRAPGSAPTLAMRPETSAYRLLNRATTGPAGTPLAVSIREDPAGTIVVKGTIAADAGQVNQTYSVKTPSAFARALFIEALERQEVAVTATATGNNPSKKLPAAGSYNGLRKVAELASPPFSEDVKLTLKVSQNLHADTYILLVAAASNKTGFYEGMIAEGKILNGLGLDTSAVMLGDGEGGDDVDHFSPRSAAGLLTLMTKRPYAAKYVNALSILGVDGSLASSCSAGNPACGRVYAKTGTRAGYDPLNDRGVLFTKSLAGHVDAKSGKRLVFAVFVNNVPISDMNEMMATGEDLGTIAGLIYNDY